MPATTNPHEHATPRDRYWVAVYLQHLAATVRATCESHNVSITPAQILEQIAAHATDEYRQAEHDAAKLSELLAAGFETN
jgi:hypothetical protein